jgi:predicted SAM-dependent methyltransferase
MRLNLGCGPNKIEGFLNVDKEAACDPDTLVDLETFPWPFATDSAEEVVLNHVLEHLGETTGIYFTILKELHRVCAPDAVVRITVPHPRHDDFLSDPTHVRPILTEQMQLLSKRINREWAAQGYANTPLGLYLDVDFEIESVEMMPDDPWLARLRAKEISSDALADLGKHQNNIIKEIRMVLRAVKDGD